MLVVERVVIDKTQAGPHLLSLESVEGNRDLLNRVGPQTQKSWWPGWFPLTEETNGEKREHLMWCPEALGLIKQGIRSPKIEVRKGALFLKTKESDYEVPAANIREVEGWKWNRVLRTGHLLPRSTPIEAINYALNNPQDRSLLKAEDLELLIVQARIGHELPFYSRQPFIKVSVLLAGELVGRLNLIDDFVLINHSNIIPGRVTYPLRREFVQRQARSTQAS